MRRINVLALALVGLATMGALRAARPPSQASCMPIRREGRHLVPERDTVARRVLARSVSTEVDPDDIYPGFVLA